MPSTLRAVLADHLQAGLQRPVEACRAPVSVQSGVEHFAEPVQDHRVVALVQHLPVRAHIVVRAVGHPHQCAAGHEDDAAAELLNGGELLVVSAQDIVQCARVRRDRADRCRSRRRSGRPADHECPPACGGSAPALRASPGPCRAGRCPSPRRCRARGRADAADRPGWRTSRSRLPRSDRAAQRVGHDMCRGEGDAIELARLGRGRQRVAGEAVGLEAPVGGGEFEREHGA